MKPLLIEGLDGCGQMPPGLAGPPLARDAGSMRPAALVAVVHHGMTDAL